MNAHRIAALVAVVFTAASSAAAQSLESRVASARGSVGFEFATKRFVCGNGSSISISDDTMPGWNVSSRRSGIHMGFGNGNESSRCDTGPARVILTRDGGRITEVRVSVGGTSPHADTELGVVSSPVAARYLLSVAPALPSKAGDHAIMGAAIADSAVIWKRLLEIARDNGATEGSRKAALFWVSQEAGAVATAGLSAVADDNDAQLSVRKDALFFLAQRKDGEGIPGLIKVVNESKSPVLRKEAIWHLSQSRDPRALDLFEKLLAGK